MAIEEVTVDLYMYVYILGGQFTNIRTWGGGWSEEVSIIYTLRAKVGGGGGHVYIPCQHCCIGECCRLGSKVYNYTMKSFTA